MSAGQSNLSLGSYGYDVVVATTQASLNATLKEYLSAGDPAEAVICYVADENGNPTPIDYATLVQNAHGSDPFSVPDGADPTTDPDLKNLFDARFMVGFRARLGLPPGYAPANIPDIVTLSANSSTVSYTLLCSEFVVVQLTPASGYSRAQWLNASQPAGEAWLFTSQVNLSLAPTSSFGKLPSAVQAQVKNLGGSAFSVQQLLFDLDNAALESLPTISGVQPGTDLYAALQKDFVGAYFSTMKEKGSPVLCCAVTQSAAPVSTLTLTDLSFWSSPFVGSNGQPVQIPTPAQQSLYTLNYLCATNGRTLPPPAEFSWNWVEPSEAGEFHGVIAINRNALVDYLEMQMNSVVPVNCYVPHTEVSTFGSWKFWLTPGQNGATVTRPPTGAQILSYAYQNEAIDNALGGLTGRGKLTVSYTLDVSVGGNAITVVQHLVITVFLSDLSKALTSPLNAVAAVGISENVVDKTIGDVFTLAVDEAGRLATVRTSSTNDNSQQPSGFWENLISGGLTGLIDSIGEGIRSYTSSNLTDIPLYFVQSFVFPGCKSFLFRDAAFSEHQDLVAHITYADPA